MNNSIIYNGFYTTPYLLMSLLIPIQSDESGTNNKDSTIIEDRLSNTLSQSYPFGIQSDTYIVNDVRNDIFNNFILNVINSSTDIDTEYVDFVNENFWDLI